MADTVQVHIPTKVALYLCSGCGHPKFIFDNPKPPLVLPDIIHIDNKPGYGNWTCGRYRRVAVYTRTTDNTSRAQNAWNKRGSDGKYLPGGRR